MKNLERLKYPIGKHQPPAIYTEEIINILKQIIADFPSLIKLETAHLNNEQLDTPYRENGWTIRQVVHHCADSHMNAFIRFKLALTENEPIIKPYMEKEFAKLSDGLTMPIGASLILLQGVHERWTFLLHNMTNTDYEKTLIHPQYKINIDLKYNLSNYAWHCKHHLAHITELKNKMKWA